MKSLNVPLFFSFGQGLLRENTWPTQIRLDPNAGVFADYISPEN
jgi:hypothetical protein